MADLEQKDIQQALNKLRDEYTKLSKEDPKLFHILPFEERYTQILKNRGDVGRFIADEIKFLDSLKGMHKERQAKLEASKAPTMNKIADDHYAKYKKYPAVEFHPSANLEIQHFYGAVTEFVEVDMVALLYIFKGSREYSGYQPILASIESLAQTKGGHSLKIMEIAKSYSLGASESKNTEKLIQNYIREASNSFKGLYDKLKDSIATKTVSDRVSIHMDSKLYPKASKKYNERYFLQATEDMKKYIFSMMEDFRMLNIIGLKK
jgi:hypothetical protein